MSASHIITALCALLSCWVSEAAAQDFGVTNYDILTVLPLVDQVVVCSEHDDVGPSDIDAQIAALGIDAKIVPGDVYDPEAGGIPYFLVLTDDAVSEKLQKCMTNFPEQMRRSAQDVSGLIGQPMSAAGVSGVDGPIAAHAVYLVEVDWIGQVYAVGYEGPNRQTILEHLFQDSAGTH